MIILSFIKYKEALQDYQKKIAMRKIIPYNL